MLATGDMKETSVERMNSVFVRLSKAPSPSSIQHVRRNGYRAATVTYKRLASLLATKRKLPYSIVMGWLRCRLSFSLLSSAVM